MLAEIGAGDRLIIIGPPARLPEVAALARQPSGDLDTEVL